MLTTFLRWLLRVLYGFRAFNESPLKTPGPVLLLPNHLSWWDWLLVGVCLDDDWRFVTSSITAETSWLHKKIMVNRRTFPVNVTSPYAVKHMAEYLAKGGRLVLFPEGRMSNTGSLMKLFDGTGFLIFKTRAKVITAYLRGAERLPFSRNPGKKQWLPRLSVHFSNVLEPPKYHDISTTEARTRITHWLADLFVKQQFETEMEIGPPNLLSAIVETAGRLPHKVVLQDVTFQKLKYRRLLLAAGLLGVQWKSRFPGTEARMGVLLPNVNALPVTLLSLWSANKVPAVLNYSSGTATMLACSRVAGLKHIITSKVFVERLKLDLAPFQAAGIALVYLEDIRAAITAAQKLAAMCQALLRPPISGTQSKSHSAVILFTSGSEGEPKAVELTHGNVLANIRQMLSVIDVRETDRFFSALPLFHSFGLTVCVLMPLVRGVFTFLYVSPLHYRVVPNAFYDMNCTVFFGTPTFLNGYARKAHPYDFHNVRYLIAGAEKLQESTTSLWMQKFGVRIIEGYGATECSPVVTANVPMRPRHGSAGRFLPGIEYRLEPVEGVPEGGRLFVRGPNIMRGYLNPEPNAKFQSLGGWYDTGDIVKVDADGFVFILGRLKRFAKVSGEMISLTAVEESLAGAFPQYGLRMTVAVIARHDADKGEKLIAVSNEPRLTMDELRTAIRARGLSNLAVPREIAVVRDVPKLGSGKVDHRTLERILSETKSAPGR
jgi:acyl-[acyl-carrier-protein]-phospholipid O-acyltransferase / long-chain-fatty-acid--[acyl-carrier-protein] ligase